MNDVASHVSRLPQPRTKAIRLGALGVGVLLLVGYFLVAHDGARAAGTKDPKTNSIPVIVGTVTTQDLPVALNGIGTVQPLSVVEVKVRVDGQLDKLAFTEGQEVHAGDLLAQIDPRPFQAQLEQAEATRAKDQAQLANARSDVTRYSTLLDTGGIPIQTMDAAKAQVAALEATVHADQAAVDTAKLQLEFTRLVSPIDGRVGMRQVNAGAIVHATDATGVVTVTQMHPISVIFSLPQDQLQDILAGYSKGKLPVVAYTRDGVRSLAKGELSVVDSQVDSATGQVRLRAIFSNSDRTLWPGSLVTARLLVRIDHDVTVVPTRAVMRSQNGEYTYVVKADKTVEMRPVKTGQSVDGLTAVLSGVTPGETVVVDGQTRIAPGTHIDARKEPAPAATSAGPFGRRDDVS